MLKICNLENASRSESRFPKEERTLATAISSAANGLGNCVGFLLGPSLANSVENVPMLLYATSALAAAPFVAAVVYLPKAPTATRQGDNAVEASNPLFSLFRRELLQRNVSSEQSNSKP